MKYEKHIFICNNKRENNPIQKSCGDLGLEIRNKFVTELKKLNLNHKIRANKSGCLDSCLKGPMIVIYPDQIWYKNVNLDDVSEIIEKTILKNEVIDRLLLK